MSEAKAIKRHAAQYDLFNRLHSIAADQRFVKQVEEEWFDGRFEVVPNQRCGNWYCDPSSSKGTYAYFKSTDGHTNNWQFNLRRSNLPLADHVERQGGIILVDSTRRGKRMPDALSKTVPIWCTVINQAIQRRRIRLSTACQSSTEPEWDTQLYLPAGVVSPSEKAQIESRLAGWAETLEASTLSLPKVTKPLRPFFIHPSTSQPPFIPPDPPYIPIICLSASSCLGIMGSNSSDEIPSVTRVRGRAVGFEYVPGAGDDDESWGRGLKPALFWREKQKLLDLEREDLAEAVDQLVVEARRGLPDGLGNIKIAAHDDGRASPREVSLEDSLVGVPSPSSRLALSLGTPVTRVQPCRPAITAPTLTVVIVEVTKSALFPEGIYREPNPTGNQSLYAAVPSAKLDSGGYGHVLSKLVSAVRASLSSEGTIVLVPGTIAQLEDVRRRVEASDVPTDRPSFATFELENLSQKELVAARKTIIPLALLLLHAIPGLYDPLGPIVYSNTGALSDNPEQKSPGQADPSGVTKADIATTLHSLVSLWPDGNPPRIALRRVNEYLMSGSRR